MGSTTHMSAAFNDGLTVASCVLTASQQKLSCCSNGPVCSCALNKHVHAAACCAGSMKQFFWGGVGEGLMCCACVDAASDFFTPL